MTDSADPSFRSQLQAGNSAWMIVSTALVLLTIPGLWYALFPDNEGSVIDN